jgi:hypothetical protein
LLGYFNLKEPDMYQNLSAEEFFDLIFTGQDLLGIEFLEEAQKRKQAMVPFLSRVLKKEKNYQESGRKFWGVIHAVYLLGILGDVGGIEGLFSASRFGDKYDIDWLWETLPESYFRMGKEAIPRLFEFVEREKYSNNFALSNEIQALWNFWEAYPEEKEKIETFLLGILKDPDIEPATRGDLIADFAQIGRKDLKPLFEQYYERGEVDLDMLPREDMEAFLAEGHRFPGFHDDLEKFYSPKEIAKRQERWKKESQEGEKREDIEDYILENYTRIPRNDLCPCGSGKKFKKCHLPWAEEEDYRLQEQEEVEEEEGLGFSPGAIFEERRSEMAIRQFLAKKNQIHLFAELKGKILEAVKASKDDFIRHGFNYYLEPVLSKISFRDKEEVGEFVQMLMAYYNALSDHFSGYPEDGKSIH